MLVGNPWPPGREPSDPTDDPTDEPVDVAGFGEPGWCCALASPRVEARLALLVHQVETGEMLDRG